MAVKSDGTLVIETGVDLDGFQSDCKKLQQAAKQAAKSVQAIEQSLEGVMKQLSSAGSEAESSAGTAEKKVKAAGKEAESAAKASREASREAGKAKKELDGIKDKKITITRMENAPRNDYDGPLQGPTEINFDKLNQESARAMSDIEEYMKNAEGEANEFRQALEAAKKTLSDMENQGKWFGDEDYDEAYLSLERLNREAKEYKKELTSPTPSANPFGMDTLAGKIRDAELQLSRLAEAGKGLGDKDFDAAYRKLAFLKTEAKEYAKELAKAPEESLKKAGDHAEVSRKKVSALSDRLRELKIRQKELDKAGIGFGYKEYDKNAKEIARLEKELKRYEASVTGAKKKTQSFSTVLGSAAKRVSKLAGTTSRAIGAIVKGAGNGAKAMSGLRKQTRDTQMSMGKMLGMSLLFSTVFRAISAVTSGIGEGFNNLVQYSDETNASLSSLMSALTRLKNSFATAFNPLLTVVSPILVSFINLISKALTYVGMFFAALTGKSSFVKAVGVQQDYRASLSGTADAANNAADATNNLADATKKADKANDTYLSGLDEIRRWETTDKGDTSGSGGSGSRPSGGGIEGISPGNMFETVPIENSIKGLADKIKKLLKAEDWEGLGKFVADGINKGLKKIYDAISWKKVGPKITKFVKAFTEAFNSLVKYLDFDLLGRTVGAGIDTLVKTFNLLIGPGGIDFKQIGRKLSQGLRGAVGEINWTELGNLLGNYFMISWNILSGFVTDMARKSGAGLTGWEELGQSISKAINGAFDRISFTEAGLTLTNGINGLFETIRELARTTDWDVMAENVSDGLNVSFRNLIWETAGKSLNEFLGSLVGFMVKVLRETDWEELGRGIGTFLSQIDWGGHLWSMVTAIADAIGSLFDGLSEGGTAGKIAAFLGKVFLAVKIANITGISSLVKNLVSAIGTILLSRDNIVSLAGKLKQLFGGGTKEAGDLLGTLGKSAGGASGGFASLVKAIAPLVGTAGLIAGVTVGVIVLTRGIAGMVESLQGGNGKLTEMGAGLHNFADGLLAANKITHEQSEELYTLIENNESAKLSNEEMYDSLIGKLKEYGLSAEDARSVLESYGVTSSTTAGVLDGLRAKISELGEGTSRTAEQIDLSGVTVKEAWGAIDETFQTLILRGDDLSGSYQGLLATLDGTRASSTSAQTSIDAVVAALESAGLPTDEFIRLLGEQFPGATQAVKSSVDTNLVGAQQTISSTMGTAEAEVSNATAGMRTSAESNLAGVQNAAESAFGNVDSTTVTKWGNSSSEVSRNLELMKQAASMKLSEMAKTVTSYSGSMYNIMADKWSFAAKRVGQIISDMNSRTVGPGLSQTVQIIGAKWQQAQNRTAQAWNQINRAVIDSISGLGDNIRSQMNSVISTVNAGISNINYSISGIEAAMNFGPWEIPTATGSRTIGFSATFPRISSVPYLASGAVIPPRSEFLAVLGDQKRGNNIEAPEALIRKIVREEAGGKKDGKVLHNVVQLNRRTLFEELIEEAKLRQTYSGKNPFELT